MVNNVAINKMQPINNALCLSIFPMTKKLGNRLRCQQACVKYAGKFLFSWLPEFIIINVLTILCVAFWQLVAYFLIGLVINCVCVDYRALICGY